MNYKFDNIAIIGFGRISEVLYLPHLRVLAKNIIICEKNSSRRAIAKSMASEARIIESLSDLCHGEKNEANLAINLTPPHVHYSVNEALISRGWNVYTEKPACNNKKEWRKLVELAAHKGVVLCSAPTLPYSDIINNINEDLKSGFFGSICEIQGCFIGAGPFRRGVIPSSRRWMVGKDSCVISDLAPYVVAPVLKLFGSIENLNWARNGIKHSVITKENNENIKSTHGSSAVGVGLVDKAILTVTVSYRPYIQDVLNQLVIVGDKNFKTYHLGDKVLNGVHQDSKVSGMVSLYQNCINSNDFYNKHAELVERTINLTTKKY